MSCEASLQLYSYISNKYAEYLLLEHQINTGLPLFYNKVLNEYIMYLCSLPVDLNPSTTIGVEVISEKVINITFQFIYKYTLRTATLRISSECPRTSATIVFTIQKYNRVCINPNSEIIYNDFIQISSPKDLLEFSSKFESFRKKKI